MSEIYQHIYRNGKNTLKIPVSAASSGSPLQSNQLLLGTRPSPPKKFIKIR